MFFKLIKLMWKFAKSIINFIHNYYYPERNHIQDNQTIDLTISSDNNINKLSGPKKTVLSNMFLYHQIPILVKKNIAILIKSMVSMSYDCFFIENIFGDNQKESIDISFKDHVKTSIKTYKSNITFLLDESLEFFQHVKEFLSEFMLENLSKKLRNNSIIVRKLEEPKNQLEISLESFVENHNFRTNELTRRSQSSTFLRNQ